MKSLKKLVKQSAFTLIGLGIATAPAHAINITTTSDSNDFANTISGAGITISNPTYNGGSTASGIFTDGLSSGINIDEGIVLTTGNANLIPGVNNLDGAGANNGLPGDNDLNTLIPGFSTFDASVLEFDFESETGELFFQYVFASEEFNEFSNSSFNDVFGFFLNGENIALIPGTNTPVSINNVNGGNPLGTNAQNPQFYVNNDPSDGGPFFEIQYDGFTKVLTAKATGLGTDKNNIKLAIADSGDGIVDSAVFIKAGTFSSTPPTQSVPEPTTILGLVAVCGFGLRSSKKRKSKSDKA